MSLPDKFQRAEHSATCTTLKLGKKDNEGDPCIQLLWNVNGFSSRWKSGDLASSSFNSSPDSAKQRVKKRRHSTDIAAKTLEQCKDGSDFQTGHAHIQHVGDNGQGKGLITPTPPESYDVINGEWQHTTDRAKPPPEFQKGEWQYTANRVKPPPGYIATSPSGVSDISMQGAIPLSDRGTLPTCIRQGGLCQVTVSPRMRAGQRPSCKHKLGSEVEPMTDDPIPLVEQNAALFCDTIGPLRHSGGMDDNASHVPKHALREQQCGRTLDEDSEPERIEIVSNLDNSQEFGMISTEDACSICNRQVCASFTLPEQSKFDKLIFDLQSIRDFEARRNRD